MGDALFMDIQYYKRVISESDARTYRCLSVPKDEHMSHVWHVILPQGLRQVVGEAGLLLATCHELDGR